MLEESDTGDIDGVGSVKATVGLKRPFFRVPVQVWQMPIRQPNLRSRPASSPSFW